MALCLVMVIRSYRLRLSRIVGFIFAVLLINLNQFLIITILDVWILSLWCRVVITLVIVALLMVDDRPDYSENHKHKEKPD